MFAKQRLAKELPTSELLEKQRLEKESLANEQSVSLARRLVCDDSAIIHLANRPSLAIRPVRVDLAADLRNAESDFEFETNSLRPDLNSLPCTRSRSRAAARCRPSRTF